MRHRTAGSWHARFLLLALTATLVHCGGTATGGTTESGSSTGDSSGLTGTVQSPTDSFRITGTVQAPTNTSLSALHKAAATASTDVIAVNPAVGSVGCYQASVESDGSFQIDLDRSKLWLLFFADRAQRGASMFLGRLISGELEALAPGSTASALDLGTVALDTAAGSATSSTSHADLLTGMGLDAATADLLGAQDDIITRYQNPDIDNDGTLDCTGSTSPSVPYFLDFHVHYKMLQEGQRATIADIIDATLPDTTVAEYESTSVLVAYPDTFSTVDTGTVTFDNSITTNEAGTLAAGTPTDAVFANTFGSYSGFGVGTTATSELPSGDIVFAFDGHTLTFADVRTPTLAELTAPTGHIFPFISFNRQDTSCTSNCPLAGVGYEWRKKTDTGWTAASVAELAVLIKAGTANLGFRVGLDSNTSQIISFSLPITSVSGTLDWSTTTATLEGVSATEFAALTTTQICHLGLSFDDNLGLRYFAEHLNAPGTCE